ncbi:hypothetical protein Dfri01_02080 [Dyadobacter frigoris]|uniref:hypothetical protein n=1 Tax=Dyadobacter frigoris TaxID=2576211 RepID=UPI0024A4892D|nr:hypothetical protein [Dyadobacter frigoris]GLU50747.1 hypothetical protein Dfri01_02080 [Dyadobacter frigoris]
MLEELRRIAFRFQIDPQQTAGHTARLSSVITVLNNFNTSFLNFIEIEFLKNDKFRAAYEKSPKVLDGLKKELELLVVDLKFSSFEAAVASNIVEPPSLFTTDIDDWKRNAFSEYKKNILFGNFEEPQYMNQAISKYSPEERNRIYKPLFTASSSDRPFKLFLIDAKGKKLNLRQPDKSFTDLYFPKKEKVKKEKTVYRFAKIYAKIGGNDASADLSKKDIKKVLLIEEMEHGTYPYSPEIIKYDEKLYVLHDKLNCDVNFENQAYVIAFQPLDICVWGATREEAEAAFNFTFHALYQNFGIEADEVLSDEAIILKNKLLTIVKAIK